MSFYVFLCLSMSFYVFLCLSMSRDALGASRRLPGRSRDALGTLPGRSGTMPLNVFLCLPMFFDVPGRFRSLPEAPGTLSGRSQDAPGLCLSMSLYARDALAASLRFPGRSRDAVKTLRDNVFLCLSMHSYVFLCPGTLFEPPRGSRDALGTLPRRSDTMSFYVFLYLSMSRDALGASQDALGTLPGRSGTMSFYVFLCPGTLSRRSQDAPRKCLSMSFFVFLCPPMSFYVFHVPGHSRSLPKLPGRSRDAPRTLRNKVFLCLSMSRDAFAAQGGPKTAQDGPPSLQGPSFNLGWRDSRSDYTSRPRPLFVLSTSLYLPT